jgi:hypothetical protein
MEERSPLQSWRKKGTIGDLQSAGEDSISYMATFFSIEEEIWKLLKLLLQHHHLTVPRSPFGSIADPFGSIADRGRMSGDNETSVSDHRRPRFKFDTSDHTTPQHSTTFSSPLLVVLSEFMTMEEQLAASLNS